VKGKVKLMNKRKKYGFITPEDGGKDIFFHFSDIKRGWISAGDEVKFEKVSTKRKHFKAINIVKKKRLRDYLTIPRIVPLVTLIGVGILVWFLLSAHQQFLKWGIIIFGPVFIVSFLITVPRKGRPRVRIGDMEVEAGAEIHIRTRGLNHLRVSRKTSKWISILGCIVTLVGFAFGVLSYELGYIFVIIGGALLGGGLGLYTFRPYWHS